MGWWNTGALLAAPLLEFGGNAWLTDEWVGDGWARWWELTPDMEAWRPRELERDATLNFPYGQEVPPD